MGLRGFIGAGDYLPLIVERLADHPFIWLQNASDPDLIYGLIVIAYLLLNMVFTPLARRRQRLESGLSRGKKVTEIFS